MALNFIKENFMIYINFNFGNEASFFRSIIGLLYRKIKFISTGCFDNEYCIICKTIKIIVEVKRFIAKTSSFDFYARAILFCTWMINRAYYSLVAGYLKIMNRYGICASIKYSCSQSSTNLFRMFSAFKVRNAVILYFYSNRGFLGNKSFPKVVQPKEHPYNRTNCNERVIEYVGILNCVFK